MWQIQGENTLSFTSSKRENLKCFYLGQIKFKKTKQIPIGLHSNFHCTLFSKINKEIALRHFRKDYAIFSTTANHLSFIKIAISLSICLFRKKKLQTAREILNYLQFRENLFQHHREILKYFVEGWKR